MSPGLVSYLSRPLVSVIIPTFNREAFLRQAVQSVVSQTYEAWELFVVDDGSTDGTSVYLETLADKRVRVLSLDHSGNAAKARNAARRSISGSLVAFLDSDDVWDSEKLALQVADLSANRACQWAYTGFTYVDHGGRELSALNSSSMLAPRGWILEQLLTRQVPIPATATVVQFDLLQSVGWFDESLRVGEDFDLWIKLAERSEVSVVPKPLVRMRKHSGNHQVGIAELLTTRDRIYEGALTRATSGHIRSVVRRERMRQTLDVARAARGARNYALARDALAKAFHYSAGHYAWYSSAVKTLLSPWTPAWVTRLYQRISR